MKDVALWFDGGGFYGFGNVRRSLELASFLQSQSYSVDLVPLSKDAARLANLAQVERARASVVVLDVPYCGDTWVLAARELGARVLALDFEGTLPPDLVISLQSVRPVPLGVRAKTGVEFAIIREEIRKVCGVSCGAGRTAEVLIILGGGDDGGLAGQVLARLPPELRCCLVQGPLGRKFFDAHSGLRVLRTPPDLPALMKECAWAVTTGGTTMLELLHLGKAVHVIPRTPAEEVFAARFLRSKALLGIGLENLRAPMLENISECGLNGRKMVDGKGCERIANELKCLLE